MDHRTNKRYKKLKIKRKQMPNKISISSTKLMSGTLDDEENFKIKRFMKDVQKFCGQPIAEETDYKASGDGLKVCKNIKEKIDKIKENGDGFNTRKNKFKENCFVKKEGLFQRGVMTKGFNKGLMPPSLTARINEDLQKMIELANGSNYQRLSDNKSNEENIDDNLLNQETCKSSRSIIFNSSNIVETEVQVDSTGETSNHRTKSDLYLQFTHFVTRCLLNSGIDKQEIKSYSDTIKESLVETYRSRLTENNLCENVSPLDFNANIATHLNRTPSNCSSTLEQLIKTSHSCPSTSKSEGLEREKFTFTNDSQVNNDIVTRKPVKKLYASGLDYLKAVYSGSSDSSKKYATTTETNSFSPIQHVSGHVSSYAGECYSRNNLYELNSFYNHNQVSQSPLNSLDHNENNRYNNNFSHDTTTMSLQYFPGNSSTNRYSWNKYSDACTNPNAIFNNMETETNIEQPSSEESPKYISLLPTNHRFYNDLMTSLYNVNSVASRENINDQDASKTIHHTLLSLPVHPPRRKSPDIQYLPRKMF